MHSSEQLDCFRHSLFARLLICDICLDCFRYTAFFFYHSFRLLHPLQVVVEKRDFGSVPGEQYGGRSAVSNLALR